MKKLIIALFAFTAMLTVAGSASAAIDQYSYVVYDTTNGYGASALIIDGKLQIVYETSGDAVLAVDAVTGVDELVGLANNPAEDNLFYIVYKTETGSNVGDMKIAVFVIGTGVAVDVTLVSNVRMDTPTAVSSMFDTTGAPVFLMNLATGDPNDLILVRQVETEWPTANLGFDCTGEKAIWTDVTDYITIACAHGSTIYVNGYNSSLVQQYSWSTGTSLAAAPTKIVSLATEGGSINGEYVFQEGSADGADLVGISYQSPDGYILEPLTGLNPTGQMLWDAIRADDDNAVLVYADEDTNNVKTFSWEIDNGAYSSSTSTLYSASDVIGLDLAQTTSGANYPTLIITGTSGAEILWRSEPFNNPTPVELMQLGGEEDAIPELPAGTIWKVLIAVLALGLVIGIAAFMKRKKK